MSKTCVRWRQQYSLSHSDPLSVEPKNIKHHIIITVRPLKPPSAKKRKTTPANNGKKERRNSTKEEEYAKTNKRYYGYCRLLLVTRVVSSLLTIIGSRCCELRRVNTSRPLGSPFFSGVVITSESHTINQKFHQCNEKVGGGAVRVMKDFKKRRPPHKEEEEEQRNRVTDSLLAAKK